LTGTTIEGAVRTILILLLLAAPATASAADRDRAKTLYLQGEAAFKAGRFAEALGHYSAAYQVDGHPDLLFNIAQCHRNMESYEQAVFFLERYLQEATSIEDRAQVEALIEEMEKLQVARKIIDAPIETPAIEELPRERVVERIVTVAKTSTVTLPVYVETPAYKRGWFWGLMVGAAAAVGGAVAIAVWSQRDRIPDGEYEYDLR